MKIDHLAGIHNAVIIRVHPGLDIAGAGNQVPFGQRFSRRPYGIYVIHLHNRFRACIRDAVAIGVGVPFDPGTGVVFIKEVRNDPVRRQVQGAKGVGIFANIAVFVQPQGLHVAGPRHLIAVDIGQLGVENGLVYGPHAGLRIGHNGGRGAGRHPLQDRGKGLAELGLQFQRVGHIKIRIRRAVACLVPFCIQVRQVVVVFVVKAPPLGGVPQRIFQKRRGVGPCRMGLFAAPVILRAGIVVPSHGIAVIAGLRAVARKIVFEGLAVVACNQVNTVIGGAAHHIAEIQHIVRGRVRQLHAERDLIAADFVMQDAVRIHIVVAALL